MKRIVLNDSAKILFLFNLIKYNLEKKSFIPKIKKFYGYCNSESFKVSPVFVGGGVKTPCVCVIKGKSKGDKLIIDIHRNFGCVFAFCLSAYMFLLSVISYVKDEKILIAAILAGILILVAEEISYRISVNEFLRVLDGNLGKLEQEKNA